MTACFYHSGLQSSAGKPPSYWLLLDLHNTIRKEKFHNYSNTGVQATPLKAFFTWEFNITYKHNGKHGFSSYYSKLCTECEITGALNAWRCTLTCHCTGSSVCLLYHKFPLPPFRLRFPGKQICFFWPVRHEKARWVIKIESISWLQACLNAPMHQFYLSFFVLRVCFVVELLPFGFLLFPLLLQLLHPLDLFLGFFLFIFPLLCYHLFPRNTHKRRNSWSKLCKHNTTFFSRSHRQKEI